MAKKKVQEGGILSPFAPKLSKRITDEELEKVKELLGVECVFIVAETENHHCTVETCTGHDYAMSMSGFSPDQMGGMITGLYNRLYGDEEQVQPEHD